jgi:hypothetical protein
VRRRRADPGTEPLRFPRDGALELGRVSGLHELLAAISAALPRDAVLYLEGTSFAPEVAQFLEAREPDETPKVERGTIWPRPRGFHLPLSGGGLEQLRVLAPRHAGPEVAHHLVVYRGGDVLLWAHDAGGGDVLLSRSLPAETVAAFVEALGGALRRPS